MKPEQLLLHPSMKKRKRLAGVLLLCIVTGCATAGQRDEIEETEAVVEDKQQETAAAERPQEAITADEPPLWETYKALKVIDVHNHDAARRNAIPLWDRYGIDRVVLFGNISEPSAVGSDRLTWDVYKKHPDRVIPFFSGFDMHGEDGLKTVKDNLEQGYLGIGETVAASTHSPVTSKLEWKANHPMDGNLPAIYELCAEYDAPNLLHIDPPTGAPIVRLAEALDKFPDTAFIFGHGNVYNTPDNLERLLKKHDNLYIDFFAGFTAGNPASADGLKDYIELIEKYPDRFLTGTDSGYGVGYGKAAGAIYELLDQLKPETREKVASGNFEGLLERQKPTETQRSRLKEAAKEAGVELDLDSLTKHEANVKWFELTAE
ncbi:amidohydrolase family protein [Paenibacillus thermotolerans]|uniref:amidohydrolase family protein n=1 Tax=Paenibacillus thermotolerans TaxID=3027807 RepID=UPI002367C877|nr:MULTISPECIES: amidohydrolase family protein [unclassified Paenibacillus]